jgi:hypothetical protein
MVKLTIDGLTAHRGRDEGIIENDRCVFEIIARKEIVASDDETGVLIELRTTYKVGAWRSDACPQGSVN